MSRRPCVGVSVSVRDCSACDPADRAGQGRPSRENLHRFVVEIRKAGLCLLANRCHSDDRIALVYHAVSARTPKAITRNTNQTSTADKWTMLSVLGCLRPVAAALPCRSGFPKRHPPNTLPQGITQG
jgi:hypothetical protein